MNDHALRNKILGIAGRVAQVSALVNNGNNPGYGYVDSPADDPESGEEDIQQPVRKMQWFGFRSMPPEGSEALVIGIRASNSQKVLAACDNYNHGPKDLKDGEAAVYSQFDAIIKLDKDGHVTIIPKSTAKVRLGSDQAGQLDAVALYTQLKADFDAFVAKYNAHKHAVTGTANLMTGAVAGNAIETTATANSLSSSVASGNVQAKKP